MTKYRHTACGQFVERHEHSTGSSYFLCRECLVTVDSESVEEVDE